MAGNRVLIAVFACTQRYSVQADSSFISDIIILIGMFTIIPP